MAIPLKKKETIIGTLEGRIGAEDAVILVDFMGLTVAQITDLRGKLRKDGATMTVSKNTLVRRVMAERIQDAGERDKFFEGLKGPTAVVVGPKDPILASKHLFDYARTNDKLKIKCGYYAGKYIDAAGLDTLSKLGSKEDIICKLIMSLKGPMYKLVNALNGPATNLVGTLKAVADKGASA